MDILISSNLERLIYLSAGSDAAANAALMKELNEKGSYTVTDEMREFMKDFRGGFASEEENRATIQKIFKDTGYLIDTHTGVAASVYNRYKEETKDAAKTVIASTASPYKSQEVFWKPSTVFVQKKMNLPLWTAWQSSQAR